MSEPSVQTLGRYTIRGPVGRGGFAVVYRALDNALDREVALKMLRPTWRDDHTAVERFMREARQVARLRHSNIVTVYDVGEAEGRLFIAMELVPGRSLQRVVAEDGPLSWNHALVILKQTAAALDLAHKQGLIHRDVKPANILLDESGLHDQVRAVLTDFGLVRGAELASLSVGTSGGIMGTPEYIAPEIWHGKPATVASDIYALACAAHYMLTRQVLFEAPSTPAVMTRHVADEPVFPKRWPKGVPDGVTTVLHRALAKDPVQRYTSAGQFVAALEALSVPVQSQAERVGPDRPEYLPPGKEAVQRPSAEVSPPTSFAQARRAFWWRWILASVVSSVAGVAIFDTGGVDSIRVMAIANQSLVGLIAIAMVFGVIGGTATWFVLRPWVPRASRWIWLSVAGAALSALCVWLLIFAGVLLPRGPFDTQFEIMVALVGGAAGGLVESAMWHRQFQYGRPLWIGTAILANLVSRLAVLLAGLEGFTDALILLDAFIGSAIFGAITGGALIWLLQHPLPQINIGSARA